MIKESKYTALSKCSDSFKNKTPYTKKFFDFNEGAHLYCAEDPSIFLSATRDS